VILGYACGFICKSGCVRENNGSDYRYVYKVGSYVIMKI